MKGFTISRALAISVAIAAMLVVPSTAGAFGQLGGINMVGGGPSATEFQLDTPGSIARAPDGTFYVLDQNNYKVVRLNADGEYIGAFGGASRQNSGTYFPASLALGSFNNQTVVYVSTFDGLKRFDADGDFIDKFNLPLANISVDPACGEVYASRSDSGNFRVERYATGDDPSTVDTEPALGSLLETIGQGTGIPDSGQLGKLWNPRGIAFDSTRRVFVVDQGNSRVSVFRWNGNCASRTHTYDSKFGNNGVSNPWYMSAPTAVAIDRSATPGKIYVTTTYLEHLVQAYTGDAAGEPVVGDPQWTYHGEWGSSVPYPQIPGSGTDDLSGPGGIAVEGSTAWITEQYNNRVHVYSGVSASTPFSTPTTTTDLWGSSAESDGFLKNSSDLAAAADGSVWVSDQSKYRIQRFSPKGQLLGSFGEYGTSAPEQFTTYPSDIEVAPNGELLVVGSGNVDGIKRYATDGSYLGAISWSPLTPDPISPGFLDVDGQGNIWVFDWASQKVLKLSAAGTVLAQFGFQGTGAFDESLFSPTDIAVSADGLTVYVLDGAANRVKKFSSVNGTDFVFAAVSRDTMTAGSADGQFSNPGSIALDTDGSVLVADTDNDRFQRLAGSDLTFVSKFGAEGMGSAEFLNPVGVSFDRWGNLWIGDTGNDRLKRFGDAPVVTISSPTAGSTTAESVSVEFESTDPAADCDRTDGETVPLALGVNAISVECTNAEGVGTATVMVTRTTPPAGPGTPGGPAAPSTPADSPPTVELKLAKRLKLAKQVKFKVLCTAACDVSASIKIKRKTYKLKKVTLKRGDAFQAVSLKLSSRIVSALKRSSAAATLTVQVTPQGYKATQGKSGKAKISR